MKTLRVFVVPFLLSSCASIGDPRVADPALVGQIKPGLTTKPEVAQLLGGPSAVDFTEGGLEKWLYTYTYSQMRGSSFIPIFGAVVGGTDIQTHMLTIIFRKDGVVENVGKGESRGGGGGIQDAARVPVDSGKTAEEPQPSRSEPVYNARD